MTQEAELLKQPGLFDTIGGCFRPVLTSLADKRTGKNSLLQSSSP